MQFSKIALAHGPMLKLMIRLTLGDKLTVVAFHRVLDKGDLRSLAANPEWTLETGLYRKILESLGRYFRFVSEADVIAYYAGKASLPPKALLVTFDDGWRDNFDYALEPLVRLRIPALFFISAGYVGSRDYYWQEALYAHYALQFGDRITEIQTSIFIDTGLPDPGSLWNRQNLFRLIGALHRGPKSQREAALAALALPAKPLDAARLFMDAAELKNMISQGMSIGAHGLDHEPFTTLLTPESEARESRMRLEDLLGTPVRTMSYPHGSFDAKVQEACHKSGFVLAFSSRSGSNAGPTAPFDIRRHFLPNWRLPQFPSTVAADGTVDPSLDFDVLWEFIKNNHA